MLRKATTVVALLSCPLCIVLLTLAVPRIAFLLMSALFFPIVLPAAYTTLVGMLLIAGGLLALFGSQFADFIIA